MTDRTLHVLFVEDNPDDAEIIARQLRRELGPVKHRRVETPEALERAHAERAWDVVLVDYTLPRFNGADAVRLVRQWRPEPPSIVVSGTITDEVAAELLRVGAADFILKDRPARLSHAIRHAMEEARLRAEARSALAELKSSEKRFRSLIEQGSDFIAIVDDNGVMTYVAPSVLRLFGYQADEVLGRNILDWVHPDDVERARAGLADLLRNPASPRVETFRVRHRSGEYRWLEGSGTVLSDESAVRAVVLNYHDITERRTAEIALAESEAQYRRIVTSVQEGISQIDAEDRMVFVNDRMAAMLGYAPEEMLGRPLADFIGPTRRGAPLNEAMARRHMGVAERIEVDLLHKNGGIVWAIVSASPLFDAHGHYVGALAALTDITDRKRDEEALASKNRALRTLSRGNDELIHASTEIDLVRGICRAVVEEGGYRFAWVGYVERHGARMIRPIAWAGQDATYLEDAPPVVGGGRTGGRPIAAAVRTGEVAVVQQLDRRPVTRWMKEARKRGYMSVIAIPLKDGEDVFGVLNIYAAQPDAFDHDERQLLEELANDLAFGILGLRERAAHTETQRRELEALQKIRATIEATVAALAGALELRDPYTAGHQRRVASLAAAIGRGLGLPDDRVEGIRFGALIHDIGKVYVPSEILNRPGTLTPVEFELIKTHAQAGYDIVKDVQFPWPIAEMVLQHHERLDGSGYPNGLRGEAICLEARILAVADVVEAIGTFRPYRPALGMDRGLEVIRSQRGVAFDASVVDACIQVIGAGFRFEAANDVQEGGS
ncbi:MAG TPA: PAS domain S-box protein [Chloroflexota bacterium]|nr:PAS domain S-box protein [Chloroflexota bacterium]